MPAIASLYRYPVKGLSPELLPAVTLAAGDGFPLDRRLAITNGGWVFDQDTYQPLRKTAFLTLMQHACLATLRTRVMDDGDRLHIETPAGETFEAHLNDDASLERLSDFLIRFVPQPLPGRPRLVRSREHRFTDVSVASATYMSAVSVVNLASVRDLGRNVGKSIDPLRFRANVYVDAGLPWEENDWVGREICIGAARARVLKRIKRCPATEVDPVTGARDIDVPGALQAYVGHRDMGIYVEIFEGASLHPGDAVGLAPGHS